MDNKNTFLVTYANKKTLTDTVDAVDFPDVETYCQKRYGLSKADTVEFGTKVEKVDREKPADVEKAAEAPKPAEKAAPAAKK